MAKKDTPKPEEPEKLPGLPLDSFKAATDALKGLIQGGKFLLFASRPNYVRFIGDHSEFAAAYAKRLQKESVPAPEAGNALEEVRQYLQALLIAGAKKQATNFVLDAVYERPRNKPADQEQKDNLRHVVADKVDYVERHLSDKALFERIERMTTSSSPTLHDLDAELIAERQENLEGKVSNQPYLRLRLRYSDALTTNFPFFYYHPLNPRTLGPPKTFDLDCDETDIDLMILRLLAAKDLLLQNVTKRTDPQSAEGRRAHEPE